MTPNLFIQMIRDVLEENQQSNNPFSIITNVNTGFDENNNIEVTVETIGNPSYIISVREEKE